MLCPRAGLPLWLRRGAGNAQAAHLLAGTLTTLGSVRRSRLVQTAD